MLIYIFLLLLIIFIYYYYYYDYTELKCVISGVDGNTYCVRERQPDKIQQAADLLAETTNKCIKLIDYMVETYPNNNDVIRLKNNFNPNNISESLPNSKLVAYTQGKGQQIAFCLAKNSQEDKTQLLAPNELFFIAQHELAHCMTPSSAPSHGDLFWRNFNLLLHNSKKIGLYIPVDYRKNPEIVCGMELNTNPYFDLLKNDE